MRDPAVLSEYVAQLVAGGDSSWYFIEGGRSRTGRLLQPKGGMISMTVRAFLRQPTRPVLFQPVYNGYEKLMEGSSYLDELTGKPKEKESRSEEHTSELQSLMRISYAVFCLKKQKNDTNKNTN